MQTEQDAIYSVCNSDKYTLLLEREIYCTSCDKWMNDIQQREIIEQYVQFANNVEWPTNM